MGKILVIFILLLFGASAQEDIPRVDSSDQMMGHPMIIAPDALDKANEAILGWLEQSAWSAPAWLNATVNLTRNVTRA